DVQGLQNLKSDQAQRTVCNDPSSHNVRKRILLCSCHQCQLVMPYACCPWRGKRLQCGRHNVVDVFQTGTHVTARRQPRPPRLTRILPRRWLTKLSGNDYRDDLRNMVRESTFTGHEQEFDAFTFTWRTDTEDRPYLGKGSDVDPFLVGVTTKALLQKHFVEELLALRKVYTCVTGKQFEVRYAMGVADDAQYNAVQRVLGVDNNLTILMCFYHVAAK
ncbi:hypothetical protein L915_12647, partial [Phytophthora nicotianae]